jgi:hypothetical protein
MRDGQGSSKTKVERWHGKARLGAWGVQMQFWEPAKLREGQTGGTLTWIASPGRTLSIAASNSFWITQ